MSDDDTQAELKNVDEIDDRFELFLKVIEKLDPFSASTEAVIRKAIAEAGLEVEIPTVVFQLQRALYEESDRGCVLMGAAFLESELGEVLRSHFVDDPQAAIDFLGRQGAGSSFSARVELCYLLGLIGPAARRDLNLIRKIRNAFAHDPFRVSFTDQAVAARSAQLKHDLFSITEGPRTRFIRSVMGIAGVIEASRKTAKRSQKGLDAPLTDPSLLKRAEKARQVLSSAKRVNDARVIDELARMLVELAEGCLKRS